MPFKGKSFYQDSRINSINLDLIPLESEISSNHGEFLNQTSVFSNLNSSTISLIQQRDDILTNDMISLANIDSTFSNSINSYILDYNAKISSLVNIDVREDSLISSQIIKFDSKYLELSNVDSFINYEIASHIHDFDYAVSLLIIKDQVIDDKLYSQIETQGFNLTSINFNASSLLVENEDIYLIVNSQINSLKSYDISLASVDSQIDSKILSHIKVYDEKISIFNDTDESLISLLSSQGDTQDSRFFELTSIDNQFESLLDSHITVYTQDVTDLNSVDSAFNFELLSFKDVYDSKVSELIQVDTTINSNLSSQIVAYNNKTFDLVQTDSVVDSDINIQKEALQQVLVSLQTVDSVIISNLDFHINVFNTTVSSLHQVDSNIQSEFDSYFDVFTSGITELDSVYLVNRTIFNDHEFAYLVKMVELDNKDTQQDGRLDVLDTRIETIENDISTEISSALLTLEFDSRVQIFKQDMFDEDSLLRSGIALQVVTAVQNNVDSVQNSFINQKLTIEEYDSKIELLDSINFMNENKILALEEFLRVTSLTYKINNPNGTPYIFNGIYQNIPQVPIFDILYKTAVEGALAVVIQFSQYGYNTLNSAFMVNIPNGQMNIEKSSINSTTLQYTAVVPVTAGDYVTFNYPNINSTTEYPEPFYTKTLSAEDIYSLPLLPSINIGDPVPQWGRWLDGTGTDISYGIATDSFGNVYITGTAGGEIQSELTTYFGGSKPSTGSGAFVVKYNSYGQIQWGRWIDGVNNDVSNGITTDSLGNVYITGNTNGEIQSELTTYFGGSKPGTNGGAFVVKYNSSGQIQWGRWIDGAGNDTSSEVVTDSSGNVYITGYTNSEIQSELTTYFEGTKPGANSGTFVVKYNSSGVPLWGRWLDGASTDQSNGLTIDSSGNVYITGYATGEIQSELTTYFGGAKPGATNGAYIFKYDSSGTPLWGRWLEGAGIDISYAVVTDSSDNVYMTGFAGGEIQSELTTYFGGSKPGANNGVFLVKYNSSGQIQWGRWLDGANNDVSYEIATDPSDNIYITGFTTGNVQSELTTYFEGSKPSTGNGAYIFKYNSSGTPLWGRWLDGVNNDISYGVATDALYNVYITGYVATNVQSELTTYFGGTKPSTSNGAFVVKYSTSG
jgi:hypothetical protein